MFEVRFHLTRFLWMRHILHSGLFDVEWYKLAQPHIVPNKLDALTHFLKYGRNLRLAPSKAFDTVRYLSEYEQASKSALNPLIHYLKYGRALGFKIHPAPPSDADRILESGLFDNAWYLKHNSDVAAAGFPPLLHYMIYGALEGRSPGPNFDAEWYLLRYPDIVGINPLLHYIDHGHDEGRSPKRPGEIITLAQKIVASIEDLDPELYGEDFLGNGNLIAVVDGRPRHRVAKAWEVLIGAITERPQAIVFLPWLTHGGADLVACHAIQAMVEEHGPKSVLVVLSDHDREEALHLLPESVAYLSFSQIDAQLSHSQRVDLVDLLIRNLQPEVILNVNSHACWETIKQHGKRLANFTRLYAMLFCPDFSEAGRRRGYSDLYLRHCLPVLSGIYFDNQSYIDELTQQYSIPDGLRSKLVTLYQPTSLSPPREYTHKKDRPLSILWAGRLAPQKNVDLLIRIAERSPQFQFHIWGRGNHTLESRLMELSKRLPYVHFYGPFERFDALPLENYDVLLYTSLWDGLPNVLLEAAGAGLPIVTSNVGGISELVDSFTGVLVAPVDDPIPYEQALQAIADNPEHNETRVAAMYERLQKNHDRVRYRNILAHEPSATSGFLNVSLNKRHNPKI